MTLPAMFSVHTVYYSHHGVRFTNHLNNCASIATFHQLSIHCVTFHDKVL